MLLQRILNTGYLSVEEIATWFDVTLQTARRDLTDLVESGKVRRCHGGVAPALPSDSMSFRIRRGQNIEAKRRIAEKVADLVDDGSAVFIDNGSTMEAVAHSLALRAKQLSVSTSSARIAAELSDIEGFDVTVPSGRLRSGDSAILGPGAIKWAENSKFDIAIMTVAGLSNAGEMTSDSIDEALVQQAVIRSAKRVIIAMDSTKFGFVAPAPYCRLTDVSDLVVDAAPHPNLQRRIEMSKVRLHLV